MAVYAGLSKTGGLVVFPYNNSLKKGDGSMDRIRNLFRRKMLGEFQIPQYIRQEFLQESARKNDFSLWIICGIIFAVELFNIARVLLWSQSGLGTRNNQIYFSMYCILIFIAILWLVLRRPLQRAQAGVQCAVQYTLTGMMFLWHMGLNTYDLHRDRTAGTAVLTTAMLGLALLIQSPPWFSVAQFGGGYLLFRVVMAPLLDAGDRLNLTITFVVALAVSLAYAHHTSVMLKQQKQIGEINAQLQELVRLDPLTGLLNKTTVECWTSQAIQNLEQTGRLGGVTLFLVDLDEFKRINDRYGHPCGDYVLVETAEAIRRAFPDAAGWGRVGGDEFAVFYDRPLTEAHAMALGQGLVERLGEIRWRNQPLNVQCSVGACICPTGKCTYQQLYAETDQMLYRAKETGKGRCYARQLTHMEPSQCKETER